MKHTIDAKGQKLGRVASQAASLLMGKNTTSFVRNAHPEDVEVEIINASKISLDANKAKNTQYPKYSGFPGGLRYENMQMIIDKKGYAGLFTLAVNGMLPKNKLQAQMIKKLTVTE